MFRLEIFPERPRHFAQQHEAGIVIFPTGVGLVVGDHAEDVIAGRGVDQHHFGTRLVDRALLGRRLHVGRDLRESSVIPVDAGEHPVHLLAGRRGYRPALADHHQQLSHLPRGGLPPAVLLPVGTTPFGAGVHAGGGKSVLVEPFIDPLSSGHLLQPQAGVIVAVSDHQRHQFVEGDGLALLVGPQDAAIVRIVDGVGVPGELFIILQLAGIDLVEHFQQYRHLDHAGGGEQRVGLDLHNFMLFQMAHVNAHLAVETGDQLGELFGEFLVGFRGGKSRKDQQDCKQDTGQDTVHGLYSL